MHEGYFLILKIQGWQTLNSIIFSLLNIKGDDGMKIDSFFFFQESKGNLQ